MKMSTLFYTAATLLLVSCSNTSEGELIKDNTRKGIENALSYNQEYANKRVAITGYLKFHGGSYEIGKQEITMSFDSAPDDNGEHLNSFTVKMGDGKNEVSFPKGTNAKSAGYNTTSSEIDITKITVITNSGNTFPLIQKLKVSGTVTYTKDFATSKTMEMPMFDSDKKGFVYQLEDVRFDEVK